jgi:hypothetical protein
VSFRNNIKTEDDIKIQEISVMVLRQVVSKIVVSSLSDYLQYVISSDNCNLT